MRSMTGFGAGEHPLGASGKIRIEMRSVNHRFLDVRVKVARSLPDVSMFVEQLARASLSRGHFEIAVLVSGESVRAPSFDRERAKALYASLVSLKDEIAPGSDVPFSMLAAFPDLADRAGELDVADVQSAVKRAFSAAAKALDATREEEGKALAVDLGKRVKNLRERAAFVASRAPSWIEAQRTRLKERAQKLVQQTGVELDPNRLEAEVVLFADRTDVSEELVRIDAHCTQFETLLAGSEAAGRRLDFLLQELTREANTTAAKCPDPEASHAMVEMKAEIERMREQAQNVE